MQALKRQTVKSTQVNLTGLLPPHVQPGSKGQGRRRRQTSCTIPRITVKAGPGLWAL